MLDTAGASQCQPVLAGSATAPAQPVSEAGDASGKMSSKGHRGERAGLD